MNSEIVETNVSLQIVESIFQLIRSLPKLIQKTIAQIPLNDRPDPLREIERYDHFIYNSNGIKTR